MFKNINLVFKRFVILLLIFFCYIQNINTYTYGSSEEEVRNFIENVFQKKSKAILNKDLDTIESFYNTDIKIAQYAYEYEQRKVKYINNWAEKQGIQFIDINPTVVIKNINAGKDSSKVTVLCNTEYKYIYPDEPNMINSSYIGTYHYMTLSHKDDEWAITKEWYTDPFADSLSLENIKVDSIKEYISSQKYRELSEIDERRIDAINYAKEYCGAATLPEYNFKYNKKYKNFNPEGGDCANFASQVLYEGGKFKKNTIWNYDKGSATGPWVNADKFTSYMLNSGRASLIAKGSYEKVYKESYKLLPGDFVAYEKKGDITHISVVSGADSKGYSLVTCHNTDRNDVPWDLGWSDKKIKFWLVRVHF